MRVELKVQKERKNLLNEWVFKMMIIGHITLKIWKALSSLWNVAKGLMPVVWTALIFSQLDIGKLLKRTWEDLLRVSGPCTGDQGTQKASGKVAVLSKREDFAKENWDFIWTFHLHCSNSLYIFSNPIKDIFCNQHSLSIWKKEMGKNDETCHKKEEVLVLWQGPLYGAAKFVGFSSCNIPKGPKRVQ